MGGKKDGAGGLWVYMFFRFRYDKYSRGRV